MVQTHILPSLLHCVRRNDIEEFSEETLRIWAVEMLVAGTKESVIRRYLTGLRTLYKQWQSAADANGDPFEAILSALDEKMSSPHDVLQRNLLRIKRLAARHQDAAKNSALAIALFLLYDVDTTLGELIRLKAAEYEPRCTQVADIISLTKSGNNAAKYLFMLRRGDFTDRQLARRIDADMRAALEAEGVTIGSPSAAETIKAIWIAAAIDCGVSVTDIRSIIRTIPDEYKALALLSPDDMDADSKKKIIRKVANHINDTAIRWYILNLRPRCTPDAITADLGNDASIYYPTYPAVTCNNAGKKTTVEKPYLPGILFARLRSDKVASLAGKIKESAWFYRRTRRPDSPLSYLTQSDMELFQRHIGQFTADIRINLEVRPQPFAPDTEVLITGGDMLAGRIGRISSMRNCDGTRTYTLEITEGLAARWTVADIDEALLTPAI